MPKSKCAVFEIVTKRMWMWTVTLTFTSTEVVPPVPVGSLAKLKSASRPTLARLMPKTLTPTDAPRWRSNV